MIIVTIDDNIPHHLRWYQNLAFLCMYRSLHQHHILDRHLHQEETRSRLNGNKMLVKILVLLLQTCLGLLQTCLGLLQTFLGLLQIEDLCFIAFLSLVYDDCICLDGSLWYRRQLQWVAEPSSEGQRIGDQSPVVHRYGGQCIGSGHHLLGTSRRWAVYWMRAPPSGE